MEPTLKSFNMSTLLLAFMQFDSYRLAQIASCDVNLEWVKHWEIAPTL